MNGAGETARRTARAPARTASRCAGRFAGAPLLILAAVLLTGCTSTRPPRQVEVLRAQLTRAARTHAAVGEDLAAARLERLLERFDPGAAPAPGRVAPAPSSLWGVNTAPRVAREAGLGRRLLLWVPDRLLDLLDLVSVDLRVGWGLLADVHVTRPVSLGAGLAGTLGLGWHEQRSLGTRITSAAGWRLGPLGAGFDLGFDSGTGERWSGGGRREQGSGPRALIHQEWRDAWAVGAEVQLVLAGAAVDVHPLELVDLLAGLVLLDPGHDDLATSAAQPLLERAAIDAQILRECLADRATMDGWWAAREAAGTQGG